MVDLIGKLAESRNVSPAQIALAWLLAQKPWIVPIPGTTKMHRLQENLGASTVKLSPDALIEIRAAISKVEVHGERYAPASQKMIDR
jgi:aryl-alcohol dehydrogenase-like predicted oxidoreductase